MRDKIINLFTSLKLTVACLAYAVVLIFVGTLAQVNEGLYQAQARYFKSWLIHRPLDLPMLVIPGGYLLGTVLLINLLAAHGKRFKFTKKKIGILLIHAGLVLLLLGQFMTDALSRESAMRLVEGQSKNYSESFRDNELVVIDTSNPEQDQVISISESMVARRREIPVPQTPLTLRVKNCWPNSDLTNNPVPGAVATGATEGVGVGLYVLPRPETAKADERNLPGAVVEVLAGRQPQGTWLVHPLINRPQRFTYGDKTYNIALRFTRYYEPFSIHLAKFSHDKYRGTDVPKNFSSDVRVQNPQSGEDRPVRIYMNNPLRYRGETFYQGSFDQFDPRVSILQVVKNPSWLTPYFSCALVALGLLTQFLSHLIGFIQKRRIA